MRQFVDMKPDERRMIVAAREDRVYWRGHDIWFFMHVIGETTRMRGMGSLLIGRRSLKRMKHGIRHLTQDPRAPPSVPQSRMNHPANPNRSNDMARN